MAGIELDGANQKVVLDADGDTYLEAATDDTIKVYVAGAHDATISANAINVLSGTTLTIDSGATITNSGTANGFGSNEPSSADGQALGSASAEWSDLFLADGGIIKFGNDQDTLLTHTDGTGLTLNSTNKLCFNDATQYIQGASGTVLDIAATDEIELTATEVEINVTTLDVNGATDLSGALTIGGVTSFPDGSAGAPSITNTGDTNTGIYFSAADAISFSTGGTERMHIEDDGKVSIGETGAALGTLHVKTSNNAASAHADADDLVLEADGNCGISILSDNDDYGTIHFGDQDNNDIGMIRYNHGNNSMDFTINAAERMRIPSGGGVLVSTTTDDGNSLTGGGDFGAIVNCQSGKTPGFAFQSDGLVINRSDADNNSRDCIMFYRNGSNAGNISASNTTVSYGTFLGVHYAQLTDDSKPDILVGTVMESINETSEWHMAQFTVPEYTEDEVTYPSQVLKRYIPKTNSVGDNIKFKWHKNYKENDEGFNENAVEYDAVVIKENDEEYLARVKVSDTEDSKAVYGVFQSWMESEANDISVGSLGAFMIRVHKDETVSIGDYLQSKGDGTAKVQADDILRASTIAKVVKTNKIKTYDDGSYLVSCTLHCG